MARLTLKLLKIEPPFIIAIDLSGMAVGSGVGQCFDALGRLQKHFHSFVLDGFGGKRLLGQRGERHYRAAIY